MAEDENREILLLNPILRDLPPERIDEIARAVWVLAVPRNGIIFRQGDQADGFYIVSSGKVRIFVQHGGMERELSVLGPGQSFGEIALITGDTRAASVEALSDTRVMVLGKDEFDRLLADFPDISKKFMKDMRTWLIKDQVLLEEEADVVMKASRLSWYDFLLIVGVSVLLAVSFNHSNPNGVPLFPAALEKEAVPTISAVQAMEAQGRDGALIVDAMPANFYQRGHIKGAVNMPMALFDIVYLMNFSEENKERPILVYGSTVSRPYDLEIAGKLMLLGYSDVKIITGGLSAWESMGYPVEGKGER
jgi:rhodanese-related sulfurtransferase